jgi:autotransporter-associated beta strand protein
MQPFAFMKLKRLLVHAIPLLFTFPAMGQSTYEQRHEAFYNDISGRKINLGQTDGPHRAGRTGFWTTQGRLQRGMATWNPSKVWGELKTTITNADGAADAGGANGGFSGWPGMDTYMRWNHMMPQDVKDAYVAEFVGLKTYGNGSTPNQRIMWAAACRLACETWGTAAVTANSNASNRTGEITGKKYIEGICDRTVKYNFEERWAKHYLAYTLGPLRTIADHTTDPVLANKARMTWNWGWMDIASFSFHGRWSIPAGRGSMVQDGNSSDISEHGSWLLFGGTPRANMLDADQSLLYTQPKVGVPYAVTQAPILPEMLEAATSRDVPFTRRGLARVHETQFATTYMTKDWTLYSQMEGDTTLNSDGTIKIKDLNNGGVPSNDWSSERWAVMWDETGAAGLTMKAPTGYGWCQGCGLTPYEDVVQHEGAMVGIINIPTTSEWPYTRDSIPTNTTAVINDSATTGRLFLHYSKVLIAITRSDIGNFTWPPASQTACLKRGFAIECASLSEYSQATPEERLAAFKADIIANPADMSHVNDATPRMIYTTRAGKVLDITYGQGGKVDGDPLDYEGWPLNESPWSYQSQMGNMWVFGKDRKLLWNYKNWTESEDHKPTAITNAPVAATGAATVEIDLSTRVADAETAASALKYKVTGATNGTATMLADGKTVRFTPAANFSGSSTLSFTAGGEFPDHRFVAVYDNEGTAIGKDASSNERHATSSVGGIASANRVTDVPATTANANNTRSLRLTSGPFGSAKVSRSFFPAMINFSNHDWLFASWIKRESYADDDFLFYVGDGDGFGGSGEELQVWLPAQSKSVSVRHYNAANAQTFSLSSAASIDIGEWHHVAVQFERTGHNTGVVKIFLDGKLAGTSASVTWALKQVGPVFMGGPATNTVLTRNFNGWLDDTVIGRGIFSASDIDELASASAAHLGGMKLNSSVSVNSAVLAPAGLSAVAANNAIALTWNSVAGAASYSVKRGTSRSGPFSLLTSNQTTTNYADATAVFGTTYYYVVTAVNGTGESANSNIAHTALPVSDATVWNAGTMSAWSHSTRIAFPGYTASETLTNFPMLVRLDSTQVPGFSYAQMAFSNGADLRFTDASGVELSYEIEQWNPAGTSLVWVKVPALSKGGSIIAYWGNPQATASTSPDSLSGLALWLKADALSLTDGATLNTWTDSSANARHATLAQGAPTFETNELNGKPVVRFPINGESSLNFPTLTNIRTVFWVVKETAVAQRFLLGDDNTYHFHRGMAGMLWDPTYASANVRNGTTKLNGTSVNGTATALGSGWKLLSVVTAGNVEASRLSRDRSIAGRSWDGDVAEVIIYDRALTANEELLVGGYLAQKYNLASAYAGATPGYTSNGSTWSGGFTGVWHLNSTDVNDSTSTPLNTTSNATVTAGKVANALLHNGSSQHAIIANSADVNVANNYELSGWFKMAPSDKANWRTLWAKETDSATRNWWISVNGNGQVWWTSSAGIDITSSTDLADNQWHYVAAVHDGSTARLYIDGVQVGTDSAPGSDEQTTWAVRLGSENATRWWKGSLDEFRISKVKRSAAWVKATYDNINNASWVRTGVTTPNAAGFAPMISTSAASNIGSTSATMNGFLASTGGSATTVIVYHGSTDGGTNSAAWAGANNLGARSVGNFSSNVSSIANGSTRYYRVFASNATGSTWAPETVSFVTDTATPIGLTAVPGGGLVNLTWNATAGAASYNLKRATSSGGPFTTILSGILGTSAADTAATDGSTYYYVLNAVNAGGESANSAEVTVATLLPPSSLDAVAGNASVALTWSAVSGATSYTVKRATTSGGTFSVVQSGIATTNFTDNTALNGTTYFYQVTASNLLFESDTSDEANATPSASVPTPTGLSGTPTDAGAMLSWNAVNGATHYRVKRASVSGGPYTIVADPVYAPSFTNVGLINGTAYFFVVSAMNGSVESSNSTQVSVTPGPTPTTFTTASAGNWSTATWAPQAPFSGVATTIVFNNSAAIASTDNLGTLIANRLQLSNAAVSLSGDSLFFLGSSPNITATANTAHSIANHLTLDGSATMNIASNVTTISGIINGDGGITKSGAGTLVLSGANTQSGNTAISAGAVNLRHATALGGGDVSVANGAVLELQSGIKVSGARATLTGGGPTNGALRSVSGNNEWSGDLSAISVSGVTRVGCDADTLTLSGEIALSTNSTTDQFVIQGNGATMVSGSLSGPSRVTRSNSGTGVVSLLGDNTYTGQTLLNGGVTEVESISSLVGDPGDEDVALNASGLGAPTTVANGTISMGNSGTTATLRFIGPTLKTDRVINLAGTTGGATIEQNGTGLFTLLSAFTATGAGDKTLTLSGTGTGIAAGAIVNNSATNITNLTKLGSGNWTIGGTNSYSGNTTVSAGTLLMTGSIGAGGTVTVASSATFGGSGTVTPDTTVNGHLALKGAVNFGGNLSFGASSRIKMSIPENALAAGQAIASTATVSTGAVVDVLLESNADFSNTFWNISRTFPIVTAASRTGNFTLGTVSTDIAGRPVSGYGTFSISQNTTSANLVWTPLSAIQQWRFTHFSTNASTGNAADNADPDGDGVINLAEFHGGSIPTDTSSTPVFIFQNVAGGSWSSGGNWNTAVVPVGSAGLALEIFSNQTLATGTTAVTNDLVGNFALNSLRLKGTGSGSVNINVTGGALHFQVNGAIGENGENAPFIQLGAFSSNVSVNVANDLVLGSDLMIQGTNTGNFHFTGVISGAGGITRTDVWSLLTFNGINTYTGTTVLQAGVTAISRAENFGAPSAPLLLDGGALRINSNLLPSISAMGRTVTFTPNKTLTLDVASATHTFAADIVLNQETGGLIKNGSGILTLTQPNTYTGPTTLNAGTVAISAGNQLGYPTSSLVFNGGSLRILGNSLTSLADLGRTVTFTPTKTLSFDVADAAHTFEVSEVLNQTTGALTKLGAGTLELTATNTFTGSVNVNAGVLRISQADALGGPTKSIFSTSGIGRLELDGAGSNITLPTTTTVLTSGAQAGGALRNVSGDNTISGTLMLTTGAGNSQIVSDGGSLTLAGNITTSPSTGARTLQIGGTATGTISGNIADNNVTNVVSVTKNGTGTWTLSGVNTYTGATTLSSGRLVVSGSFTSNITVNNSTLVPNNAPLTTGNLSLHSGARVEIRPSIDSLNIGGSITLTGNLDIIAAPGLTLGSTYTILNKTSTGAIIGTFTGKPQGSTFTASGYNWTISYTGGDGNDVTLTISAMSPIEQWRQLHFGSTNNNDLTDSNNDGEANLLEYATGQNPHANSLSLTTLAKNGNVFDFTYTKNKSATDISYSVEWSENFTSWSSNGISSSILTDNGTVQTIKASVSSGTIRRFMRLKVTKP